MYDSRLERCLAYDKTSAKQLLLLFLSPSSSFVITAVIIAAVTLITLNALLGLASYFRSCFCHCGRRTEKTPVKTTTTENVSSPRLHLMGMTSTGSPVGALLWF